MAAKKATVRGMLNRSPTGDKNRCLVGDTDRLGFGGQEKLHQTDHQGRDAQQQNDLVQRVRISTCWTNPDWISAPKPKIKRHSNRHREVWIDPKERETSIRHVHSQHQELTMGKVEDQHDAVDHGQADRDQRINRTGKQAVYDRLQEYL